MAYHFEINPKTEYHLLWIPQIALSLRLPGGWTKYVSSDNQYMYRNIAYNIVIPFHPADPYIHHMTQLYQSLERPDQLNFRTFQFTLLDALDREYEAKKEFNNIFGIKNMI